MGSRFLDIVSPGRRDPVCQGRIYLAHDSTRNSHDQGAGWYLHPFGHHSACRDHAARPDRYPVEQDAAHCDEAIITDGAAVQDDAMPYADPPPDRARHALIDVYDRAVLNIGLGPDHDRCHITPDYSLVPDACLFAQRHVAHDRGGRRDKRRGMDVGHGRAPY